MASWFSAKRKPQQLCEILKKYMFYGIAFGAPTNTRTRSASMIGCGDGELLPFRCLRRVQGEGEGGP